MASMTYSRRAITRIEVLSLLFVLCIAGAVLIPSLKGQDELASRATCAKHLAEISRGAIQYANDNNDWILGSPNTSGAYLLQANVAFGPAVQVWDFMGPLRQMWFPDEVVPATPSNSEVVRRFNKLIRGESAFTCPENSFLATSFAGPYAGTGPMISYNTCRTPMYYQQLPNGVSGLTIGSTSEAQLPLNYSPRVSSLGKPENKVFCADGAVFSSISTPPDYDLRVRPAWGGAFSAAGPFNTFSKSWDRTLVPGNGPSSPNSFEARRYAFRHSVGTPPSGAPGNAFRMNLAFYDGHVETQGDLDATNPHQWLPMGTVLNSSECWNDTRTYFSLPAQVVIAP